ncbi:MAG: sulfurtransferase-like selenium metabolism protein YedF [Candidatus Delongbacteria bacterium]
MTLLYLSSDRMGQGDDALGRKLLKSFLKELAASAHTPDMVGCVNDGVLLTTTGSPVLEELGILAARGARIASCGTCLDDLQRRDQLLIGEVGTMSQIVQVLFSAERVIRI